MKNIPFLAAVIAVSGCATLTSDAMTPIAFSFSDGSAGECKLTNKRGDWTVELPTTASVRRSDDPLKYRCKTADGREAEGQLASTVGAKIVASAVFIDLGITDAITDKHREYPASFVIPIGPKVIADMASTVAGASNREGQTVKDVYTRLQELDELRKKGILTEEEFEAEKRKVLTGK